MLSQILEIACISEGGRCRLTDFFRHRFLRNRHPGLNRDGWLTRPCLSRSFDVIPRGKAHYRRIVDETARRAFHWSFKSWVLSRIYESIERLWIRLEFDEWTGSEAMSIARPLFLRKIPLGCEWSTSGEWGYISGIGRTPCFDPSDDGFGSTHHRGLVNTISESARGVWKSLV